MAAKMNRITGIPREKLAEMGAMARKMALENFSYQVLEGQYMEIVNKVLERAKP
jgi:hypothetical protein